ncbi:modification methylase PvuII [Kordia sp. SMS9]|uniref:DNA-methyltransferase n=1 Tax=Kordia sp. SMS9 TaxID=2282170 RepID=UPI000E0D8934|nr:site-specific DNA-methyltransferase [Kordia sp. SMS9]AXG71281.1 modification methylase PvuII [Kordia sp. SMS9]
MFERLDYTYKTELGRTFCGDSLELIPQLEDESIDLVMTSPPFALLRKKEYGNKDQHEYVEWLAKFGELIMPKLKENGSLVIDLGGAYRKGFPTRSLYNFRVLIHFCDTLGYHLAEEFFWYNPSKLPGPIEWVNKRKIRTKDSVNTVWWFSKTEFPKADIRKVLVPYSDRMKKLIKNPDKYYKPAVRPSGHSIGKSFGNDNGGAIPSNLLSISNSESNSKYMAHCKLLKIKGHPARFPSKLPEFFINFLTDEEDIVLDIFGGSNTTGEAAERLNRKWLSFEMDRNYVANSIFRFLEKDYSEKELRYIHDKILSKKPVDLTTTLINEMNTLIK